MASPLSITLTGHHVTLTPLALEDVRDWFARRRATAQRSVVDRARHE